MLPDFSFPINQSLGLSFIEIVRTIKGLTDNPACLLLLDQDSKIMLIVTHGQESGRIDYKDAILKMIHKYSDHYTIGITCCYPNQVVAHNPELSPYILFQDWKYELSGRWYTNRVEYLPELNQKNIR